MLQLIGGILLIVGTAVGAGILALPVVCAQYGMIFTIALLVGFWLLVTFAAFLILEVNLWLPEGSSFASMARLTLGRAGQIITWFVTVFLMYAVMCAYVAGNGDILHSAFEYFSWSVPYSVSIVLVTLLFALVVCRGISSVDLVNRFFMIAKFLLYFLLIFLVLPQIDVNRFVWFGSSFNGGSLLVMATAFGFAVIVPSLRSYFHGDVKKVRQVILFGSLAILAVYVLWIIVTRGALSASDLAAMVDGTHTVTVLAQSLGSEHSGIWLFLATRGFTSICTVTSFLGVALSLSDFLADGLKIKKSGYGNLLIIMLTFLPPIIIVLIKPAIFVLALQYAGIFAVVLIILLPALMAYFGRYVHHVSALNAATFHAPSDLLPTKSAFNLFLVRLKGYIEIMQLKQIVAPYRVYGGRLPIIITIVLSSSLIIWSVYSVFSK